MHIRYILVRVASVKANARDVLAAGVYFREGLASQTDHSCVTPRFRLHTKVIVSPMGTKLRFVLLLLCLPAVLAYPRPPGEEGKEEDRTEGADDGEVDEEEEEGDDLEGKEFSPPDHIAGAPLERDGHLNTVS